MGQGPQTSRRSRPRNSEAMSFLFQRKRAQKTFDCRIKFFSAILIFLICTTAVIPWTSPPIYFIASTWAQTQSQPKPKVGSKSKAEGKKTGGIVGDPSRQRGFELGYDAGPKAAKEDQARSAKLDASARPEYTNPDLFYRYEFGSRIAFISGFQNGFLRGYNSSFSKLELKNSSSTNETVAWNSPPPRKARLANVKASGIPPKKIILAEDAL